MSVAASTVPVDLKAQDGDIIEYWMTSGETIYKGDIVRIVAAGTATSDATPADRDLFAGVATETVVDVGGLMKIPCYTTGVFSFVKDTPAQTDVGCLAYLLESANPKTVGVAVTGATGGDLIIGAVVGIDPDAPTTNVLVKIHVGLNGAVA